MVYSLPVSLSTSGRGDFFWLFLVVFGASERNCRIDGSIKFITTNSLIPSFIPISSPAFKRDGVVEGARERPLRSKSTSNQHTHTHTQAHASTHAQGGMICT